MVSVTVDNIVLSSRGSDDLYVLLVVRGREPFLGDYAFPGGFVEDNETLENAAIRELHEETGLVARPFSRLDEFSDPDRDPRGRIISFPFIYAVLGCPEVKGADDASSAEWVPLSKVETGEIKLAFDHLAILETASDWLAETVMAAAKVRPLIRLFNDSI